MHICTAAVERISSHVILLYHVTVIPSRHGHVAWGTRDPDGGQTTCQTPRVSHA